MVHVHIVVFFFLAFFGVVPNEEKACFTICRCLEKSILAALSTPKSELFRTGVINVATFQETNYTIAPFQATNQIAVRKQPLFVTYIAQ